MKINNNYLISATLLLALSACGKSGGGEATSSASAPASAASLPSNGTGNNYVTGSTLRYVGADGRTGALPAGTSVTMLETRGDLVHVGIDSDDASLPSEAWVKLADAQAARFDAVPESDLDDVDGTDGSLFEDAGRRVSRGMTYCYRYVKQYMLDHHLVSSYLPGASAYMAASVLPKYGFHRISGGPENARVNDVCVYRGGRGGNGHAEIRVQGGWYYGYGVKPHPISRANHPFLGCFRK